MASGIMTPIAIAVADGPAVTTSAVGGATCLPPTAKYTFPPNSINVGTVLRITAQGRISNVVTTPGTARLDIRLGGTVVYDTLALALNTVVKTNLPWWFDAIVICRAVGTGASFTLGNFFGFGRLQSESIVGSPLPSTGGSGSLVAPTGVPAIGANVDLTVSNTFDVFFTQTVNTGSFTVHNLVLESGSALLA